MAPSALLLIASLVRGSAARTFDSTSPFTTAPIPLGLGFPGPSPRSLAVRAADVVNARDYFARGDGTGTSPSDEGVDIAAAPWNNWTR